ncbi:heme peroxidase [Mycena galopus ATCC 62051]|nr:heme peroxidase [Mycena galopus ATCC 62051]
MAVQMRLTLLCVCVPHAIGFSTSDPSTGTGADGSIFIFGTTELTIPPTLASPTLQPRGPFHPKTQHLGRRLPPFMFGRVDATFPAPDGTVPEPFQTADVILAAWPTLASPPQNCRAPGIFFVETQLRGTLFPGTGGNVSNQGEVESPIAGELRLQSDSELARDPTTACLWQANVNNQKGMALAFQQAFAKMQVVGQECRKWSTAPTSSPLPQPCVCFHAVPQPPTAPGAAETIPEIVQDPATDGNCQDGGSGCVLADF